MKNKKDSGYLSISDFSKISGLSRKALIFYDNSGLFSPVITKENGYRYYSHEQIYTISVISLLRELGMSHKEIKSYMTSISPEKSERLLEEQEEIIGKKMKELEEIKRMIKERRKSLAEGMNANSEVEIISIKEIPIFISDDIKKRKDDISDSDWTGFYIKQVGKANAFGYPEGYAVCTDDGTTVINIISYVGAKKNANAVIREGEYLTVTGQGNLEDSSALYKKLRTYAKKNGLHLLSPSYEKLLIDTGSTKDMEKQVVRILSPFCRE